MGLKAIGDRRLRSKAEFPVLVWPPIAIRSDIEHERRVALTEVLSSELPIYPDFATVENCLKLEANRRIPPFTRSVEVSPIPRNTAIVDRGGIDLPGVRHVHLAPNTGGFVGFVPTLLLAGASGIRAKPPLAADTYWL